MIQWEYSIIKRSSIEFNEVDRLNVLGNDGWEFVFADATHFLLKRKIEKPKGRPKR